MKSAKKSMRSFEVLRVKAIEIAKEAHKGQVDKGGHDYIGHPLRVEAMCKSDEERLVAILHDVIEDGGVTSQCLLEAGFSQIVVDAILSISRIEGEHYFEFIQRCKSNPIGRIVKLCDLRDNMDITRLKEISNKDVERLKRYHMAYLQLNECD